MQGPETIRKLTAWLAAFVLIALGAKLWTIQLWATNLPYFDQWDEFRLLFRPWLEGTLSWRDLFISHNEHRIAFTRLLDLLEVKFNGTWDIYLQTVVNAFIHIAYGCGLVGVIWQLTGRQRAGLICAVLLPLFALPFAAENTIHGFQSQFYFANIFSVIAMLGLGLGKPCGKYWFIGLFAALCALFTMASGFLASAAVVGLVALRGIKTRTLPRSEILTALCALMVVALGLALKVDVAQHVQFQSHSVGDFLRTLLENLAWPFSKQPALGLLFSLPLVLVAVKYFRGGFADRRGAEFVLVLGGWAILQALALAYGRARIAESSRYLDALSALPLANGAALFVLAAEKDFWLRLRKIALPLALLWAGIMIYGQVQSSRTVAGNYLEGTRGWGLAQVLTVRNFLAAPDAGVLRNAPREAVPYWSAEWLEEILRQRKLVALLPMEVQANPELAKKGRFSGAAETLVLNAVPILITGILLGVVLTVLALRDAGSSLRGEGSAWLGVMLALLLALSWAICWRGMDRGNYAVSLYKQLVGLYANSGRVADAAQHLREILKLQPGNAVVAEELRRLESTPAPAMKP